jgi:hypothetical protein
VFRVPPAVPARGHRFRRDEKARQDGSTVFGGLALIDKFMSRFKIQTKVIVLVLPFVVSISAVGLTGLYA